MTDKRNTYSWSAHTTCGVLHWHIGMILQYCWVLKTTKILFFLRFLTNQWFFIIFNDIGWTRIKFGRFEYFFVSILPVFWELLRKNQNGDTSRCCSITVDYFSNTANTCTIFFTIMRGYFNILKWYNHITKFSLLIKLLPTIYKATPDDI